MTDIIIWVLAISSVLLTYALIGITSDKKVLSNNLESKKSEAREYFDKIEATKSHLEWFKDEVESLTKLRDAAEDGVEHYREKYLASVHEEDKKLAKITDMHLEICKIKKERDDAVYRKDVLEAALKIKNSL